MRTLLVIWLVFLPRAVFAQDYDIDSCFVYAAKKYNVNSNLLRAIAKVESNYDANAENHANRNGTSDYGIMQINSIWFSKLEEIGITEERVKSDACMNIFVGAWILAQNFKQGGFSWESVGAYNAGFGQNKEAARWRYVEKVRAALKNL